MSHVQVMSPGCVAASIASRLVVARLGTLWAHRGSLSASFKDRLLEFTIEAIAPMAPFSCSPGDGPSGRNTELLAASRSGAGPPAEVIRPASGSTAAETHWESPHSEPVRNYSSAPRWRHEVLAASPPALKLNGTDATSLWAVHFSLCARAGPRARLVTGERPAGLGW